MAGKQNNYQEQPPNNKGTKSRDQLAGKLNKKRDKKKTTSTEDISQTTASMEGKQGNNREKKTKKLIGG